MALLRLLIRFWFFLLAGCYAAYLLPFNQERIYVNLPGIGEFKVITSVAFIICFLIGASAVTLFFFIDIAKKSFEVRKLRKRLKLMEGEQNYQEEQRTRHTAHRIDAAPAETTT